MSRVDPVAGGARSTAGPRAAGDRADVSREALRGYLAAIAVFWIVQAIAFEPTEPFYNNDETRHVMTGVFVRDTFASLVSVLADPFGFADRYFARYPALSLLTWPPAYYTVEGVWFLAAGTSMVSAKVLIGLHASLAAWFVHRLAVRTHGTAIADATVALLVVGPLFVTFGRQVMLEMPTMAYALGSIWCAQRVLDHGRLRDAIAASAWAAAAALTRFDGFFVLAAIAAMVVLGGRRDVLRTRLLPVFAAVYVVLVLPYYLFMVAHIGWFHLYAIVEGTGASSTGFLAPENFRYYLAGIPAQVGWPVTTLAIAGGVLVLRRRAWSPSVPWIALAASTYAMAVPVAEIGLRHTIYWTPVFALLAAIAVIDVGRRLQARLPSLPVAAPAVALVVLLAWRAASPAEFVRGYEAAARHVLAAAPDERFVLFDGTLNANFIYQVRRHDDRARLSVLRADKLLYSVLSDPNAGYRVYTDTPEAMLALIDRHDPARIVVENRQLVHDIPAGTMLRELLAGRPDLFELEAVIPIETSRPHWADRTLLVYRKRVRNPDATPDVEFELWSIGRTVRSRKTPP